MIGLIFGALAAVVTFFFGKPLPGLLVGSAVFLPVALGFRAFFWHALSHQEESGTPKLFVLCEKDPVLRALHLYFLAFPMLTIASYAMMNGFSTLATGIFSFWLIFLGLSFDLLLMYLKRVERYLDPFFGIEKLEKEAVNAITNRNIPLLCDWIDAVGESGFKAVVAKRSSLTSSSLDALTSILRNLLSAAPTLALELKSEEEDPLTYTLFYLFQRMDLLFEQSLKEKQEGISSQVISSFGKAVIDCAKCDLSMASYPLHYLGRFGKRAGEENDADLSLKVQLTLIEVTKELISEIDLTFGNLKEPFLILIAQLHDMAKETFRKNKRTDLSQLMLPFKQLKEIFSQEKIASHQDTPVIIASLNQVIGEFQALDALMHTIPPIPNLEQEAKPPES